MNCIVYNKNSEILRGVSCPSTLRHSQAKKGEFVMKGTANGTTQKIKFDGFDEEGQPINPRVVDKTPEEIEAKKPKSPPEIPFEKQVARVTNEQWQDVLRRLTILEG